MGTCVRLHCRIGQSCSGAGGALIIRRWHPDIARFAKREEVLTYTKGTGESEGLARHTPFGSLITVEQSETIAGFSFWRNEKENFGTQLERRQTPSYPPPTDSVEHFPGAL
jgi:hypothetical protein